MLGHLLPIWTSFRAAGVTYCTVNSPYQISFNEFSCVALCGLTQCAEKTDLAPSDFSFSPKPLLRNAWSDCQGAIYKVDDTEIRRLAQKNIRYGFQFWTLKMIFRI